MFVLPDVLLGVRGHTGQHECFRMMLCKNTYVILLLSSSCFSAIAILIWPELLPNYVQSARLSHTG